MPPVTPKVDFKSKLPKQKKTFILNFKNFYLTSLAMFLQKTPNYYKLMIQKYFRFVSFKTKKTVINGTRTYLSAVTSETQGREERKLVKLCCKCLKKRKGKTYVIAQVSLLAETSIANWTLEGPRTVVNIPVRLEKESSFVRDNCFWCILNISTYMWLFKSPGVGTVC